MKYVIGVVLSSGPNIGGWAAATATTSAAISTAIGHARDSIRRMITQATGAALTDSCRRRRGRTTIASVHNLDLILTLAGGLSAALVFGYITQRIGLSPIVGYLLAGTLVGPYTPGFVADGGIAEQLAEVGVILLMFGVGLQFHVEELLAVRRVAVPGAIAQSLAATALGAVIAHGFGWTWSAGIVFGMALSVASTVVLVRILSDNRDLHTPTGHIAVGWLVVEDLFTVIALVLLPALFGDVGGRACRSRSA